MPRRTRSLFLDQPTALEARRLLSALGGAEIASATPDNQQVVDPAATAVRYQLMRITNPTPATNHIEQPIGHVLVQARKPIRGQTYNILLVTVRNSTGEAIDASRGYEVRFPGQRKGTPILKGSEVWEPGKNITFYVLTKHYYPLRPQASSGFEFKIGNQQLIAIPGPGGIGLRMQYQPKAINRILDYLVLKGPGVQGGKGLRVGLPSTATFQLFRKS